MIDMAVLAKKGIEVRTQLCVELPVAEPMEPIYELEFNGETEAEKRKRYMGTRRKRSIGKDEQQEFKKEDHFKTNGERPEK